MALLSQPVNGGDQDVSLTDQEARDLKAHLLSL